MDYTDLEKLFDALWPLPRSITGPGVKESLEIIQELIPIEIREVKTGVKAFDWTIPQEWKLNSATLHSEEGVEFLNTDASNLHVLNFRGALFWSSKFCGVGVPSIHK